MQNKLKTFSALALISLFGLTACDDIIAKPSGYDDGKIATIENYDEEIYNNMMDVIYDAIHDGSIGSDVLNDVLYQYSLTIFGAYDSAVKASTGITLKEAYDDVVKEGSTYSVVNEFILKHKAYWTVNNDGERIDDNGNNVSDDATPSDSERERVKSKFENIEERIAKAMYNNISGGSYSDRNLFKEENYLMNLRNSLYKVAPLANNSNIYAPQILDPQYEDVTVFSHFLHRENYQDPDNGITYIEDEIIPNIYNEMLVEQYILDNQYNTLGRSYARKVNVISIKTNEEYPLAARYLVSEFVKTYISGENACQNVAAYYADRKAEDSEYTSDYLDVLKILSNSWKGITTGKDAISKYADNLVNSVNQGTGVLAKITYDKGDGEEGYYYEGTEYGDVVEDYLKIDDDPLLTDTSIESTFTNSGAYTKEVGLELKEREVELKDHTTTGWYIKNGGLTDLPDSIRTRLFNVGVANALDNDKTVDRWATGTYTKPVDETSYIAKINGNYFLKNNSTESADSIDKDMIFFDSDSNTYYIIQVVEAASTSKLSKINDNSYFKKRPEDAETFVNEICEKVATNSTYKTLSTKYWLEKAGIKYHDETVFEYFKDNYPDLFD